MTDVQNCTSCGEALTPNAKFCTTCGTPLSPPEPRSCRGCGSPLSDRDKFCTSCGVTIEEAEGTSSPDAPTAEIAHAESPWGKILEQLRTVTSGRFEVERELGQGGMAAVYLARDVSLSRAVAIKVMSPGILMEPGMLARFKQEAVTIAALKHPNIITVHSVEHHEGLHFFVLDLVEGGSLEKVIQECGPLPIPVVLAWFAQVGSALEYAHRRGVVHRDIKPANILLDTDGHAIVTDFGIAKVAKQTGLTMTGATIGTPTYMSPEQCLAFEVAGASDQYSFGIVVYEMLTGKPPFTGSALAIMRAHTEQQPPPIREVRPDCPPELARVVQSMLEKDTAARWPNMADAVAASGAALPAIGSKIADDLARLVRGESTVSQVAQSVTPVTPLPPSTSGERPGFTLPHGKKVWIGGVAAGVVGVLLWLVPWGGGDAPLPPSAEVPGVVSVQLSPTPGRLVVGDSFVVSATPLDSAGAPIAGETVTWQSSDEAVVVVTDGQMIAVGPGTAAISARAGGEIAMSSVTVTEPAAGPGPAPPPPRAVVASVEVTPGPITITAGQSQFLSAAALAANGQRITGRTVQWSVSDESIATISQQGEVRAVGAGTAQVTATIDGRSGASVVTVGLEAVASVAVTPSSADIDQDATERFSVLVQGTSGRTLTDRAVQWQSSDRSVATVSVDGLVTGVGGGTATISASSGGLVSQATVTVSSVAPAMDVATAEAQARVWIQQFVAKLDRALRQKSLSAVADAYEVDMAQDDVQEWTQRLDQDGDWTATLVPEEFPGDMVGDRWVKTFYVESHFAGGGGSADVRNGFRAVFRLSGNQLVVETLRILLGQ